MGEVLSRVLLLTSFELFVVFANEGLEDSWADTVLVKLFLSIFYFFTLHDYCSGDFLLRIFSRLQSNCKLGDLAMRAIG